MEVKFDYGYVICAFYLIKKHSLSSTPQHVSTLLVLVLRMSTCYHESSSTLEASEQALGMCQKTFLPPQGLILVCTKYDGHKKHSLSSIPQARWLDLPSSPAPCTATCRILKFKLSSTSDFHSEGAEKLQWALNTIVVYAGLKSVECRHQTPQLKLVLRYVMSCEVWKFYNNTRLNLLMSDDWTTCHETLATCCWLAQSVLKLGSAIAEWVR